MIGTGFKVDLGVNYNLYEEGGTVDPTNIVFKRWGKSVAKMHTEVRKDYNRFLKLAADKAFTS
jgi:hypothetical protein